MQKTVQGKAKDYMHTFYERNLINPSKAIDNNLPDYLLNFEVKNTEEVAR